MRDTLMALVLILLLLPFPLISIGATQDIPVFWWIGLAFLAIGGAIPVVLRFTTTEEDAEGKEEGQGS